MLIKLLASPSDDTVKHFALGIASGFGVSGLDGKSVFYVYTISYHEDASLVTRRASDLADKRYLKPEPEAPARRLRIWDPARIPHCTAERCC
jgi:hypothetical protein